MTRPATPAQAWAELERGNARFVAGRPEAVVDPEQRRALAGGQQPFALVLGCSDSRVAAELVFDRGLGELFVVRTAGHVIDTGVLGSVEFGVGVLGIPLVLVLGHDRCGALQATVDAVETGQMPGGFLRDLVERVTPSVLHARRLGETASQALADEHVRQTARLLIDRSTTLADAVERGRTAVLGCTYSLTEGRARLVDGVGGLPGLVEDA